MGGRGRGPTPEPRLPRDRQDQDKAQSLRPPQPPLARSTCASPPHWTPCFASLWHKITEEGWQEGPGRGGPDTDYDLWVFSPYQAIPRTPAGCPTIQLNSDTIYLVIASDLTRPGCLLSVLRTNWLQMGGVRDPSSGSIDLLEWLTDLRETFYLLDHPLITKGCNPGMA